MRHDKKKPTTIVVFGITGDLARRMLIPALYHLHRSRLLPEHTAILGVTRRQIDAAAILRELQRGAGKNATDAKTWQAFCKRVHVLTADISNADGYAALRRALARIRGAGAHCQNILYYLAVPPPSYPVIAQHLHACGLARECARHKTFSRIIIEKPFGHSLASSRHLNGILRQCFGEEQIYRIDHYLGKETVQNILTFRFANDIFSPLWNRHGIDHVQITAAETLGVENRGAYYDATGALRDMVQNHLLQLLAHIAMEEPREFSARAVRANRIRVLGALRLPTRTEVLRTTVRGQYGAGNIEGRRVPGYRFEPTVPRVSATETFVSLKAFIENDCWRGVPFYIRTGKRMEQKYTEIVVQFKERSPHLFHGVEGDKPNAIIFRIQPDESITVRLTIKKPGYTQEVRSADTTLCYAQDRGERLAQAYERLLLDALQGDQTLFAHTDEIEAQWKFVSRILDVWQNEKRHKPPLYAAGSWGPKKADALLRRDGRVWMPWSPGVCTPLF